MDTPRALQDNLEFWRRKGALGKLRNIIMRITDRHAGGGRAREFKALQIESQNCLLDDEPRRTILGGAHIAMPSRRPSSIEPQSTPIQRRRSALTIHVLTGLHRKIDG
jgi:hypothetical protein